MAIPVPVTLHLSGTIGQAGFNNFPVEAQYPLYSSVMHQPGNNFSTLSFRPMDYGFINDANLVSVSITEIPITADAYYSGFDIVSYTLNSSTIAASFPLSITMLASDTLTINFSCTTWWLSGGGGEIGVGGKDGGFFGDTNVQFSLTQSGVTGITNTLVRVRDPGDIGIYDRWPANPAILADIIPGAPITLFDSRAWSIITGYYNEFSSSFYYTATMTAVDINGNSYPTNLKWSTGRGGVGVYTDTDIITLTGNAPGEYSKVVDITMTLTRSRNNQTMPGATHCLGQADPKYQLITPATVSFTRRFTTVDSPELRAPTLYTIGSVSSPTELTTKEPAGITMAGGFTGNRHVALVCTSHPLDAGACVGFKLNGNPVTSTNYTINGQLAKVIEVGNGNVVIPQVQTPPFNDNDPETQQLRTFQLIPYKNTSSIYPNGYPGTGANPWIQAEWSIPMTLPSPGYGQVSNITFYATTTVPPTVPAYFNEFHRLSSYPGNEISDMEVSHAGLPYDFNITSPIYGVTGLGTDSGNWRGGVSWVKLRPHTSYGYVDYGTDPILKVYENTTSLTPIMSGTFVKIENGNRLVLYARNPATYTGIEQFEIIFGCKNPSGAGSAYFDHYKYIKRTARPRDDVPTPALAFPSVAAADPGIVLSINSTAAMIGFDETLEVSVLADPISQDMTGWSYSLTSARFITAAINLPITVSVTPPTFPGTGSFPFGQRRVFTVKLAPVGVSGTVTTASFSVTIRPKSDNVSALSILSTSLAVPGQAVHSEQYMLTGFDGDQTIYCDDTDSSGILSIQKQAWDSPYGYGPNQNATVRAGYIVSLSSKAPMGFYPDTRTIHIKQIQNSVPVNVGTWIIDTKAGDDTKLLGDF